MLAARAQLLNSSPRVFMLSYTSSQSDVTACYPTRARDEDNRELASGVPSIAGVEFPRERRCVSSRYDATNLSLLCLVSLVGCTKRGPAVEDKHVAGWANSSSALGVFAIGYEPLGFADGAHHFEDPACPVTSDDGTTVTIHGACTDNKGTMWAGTATVVRDGTARHITLDGYGNDALVGMERTSGRFDVTETDNGAHAFDVDVRRSGGIETTIRYTGTVTGAYQGRTVWNGSGHISRDGLTINSGSVDAVTVDEVRDDAVCAGQGASGTTTLTSDAHEVVIAYDGATDCDPDAAATGRATARTWARSTASRARPAAARASARSDSRSRSCCAGAVGRRARPAGASVQLRHAIRSSASSRPMPRRIRRSMPRRATISGGVKYSDTVLWWLTFVTRPSNDSA